MLKILLSSIVFMTGLLTARAQEDPTKAWAKPMGGLYAVTKKSADWGKTKAGALSVPGKAGTTAFIHIIADSNGAVLVQSGKEVLLNTALRSGENNFLVKPSSGDSITVVVGAELVKTSRMNFLCSIYF